MKNKHFFMKSVLLIAAVALFAVAAAGCSQKQASPAPAPSQTASQTAPPIDKDLTKQLTSEKNMLGGQVYFQGEYVIATMSFKPGADPKTAQKLAQQYADKLKTKYKNKKVNVQAVVNGKNVANITKA
jgi:ABC-type glycerol-3-phosphate transport system substrate-binding protein